MAVKYVNHFTIQPNRADGVGNNGLTFALNDATDEFSIAFILPTADLAKIAFYIASKTGTPVAYDIRIETDDGTGLPSGTLAWTNATGQLAANAAAGWSSLVTLTASGGTQGELYHCRIKANTNPANTNYISVQMNGQFYQNRCHFPCYILNSASGGAWTYVSAGPVFVGEASNGDRFGQVFHNIVLAAPTNTLWCGSRIVVPVSGDYWGCSVAQLNSTSAGIVSAKLINSSNVILATASLPAGIFDRVTARNPTLPFIFDSPQTLAKGDVVRLVWKDTGAAWRFDCCSCDSAYKAVKPGSDQIYYTQGTSSNGTASPTVWTDTDTQECSSFSLLGSVASSGGSSGPTGYAPADYSSQSGF